MIIAGIMLLLAGLLHDVAVVKGALALTRIGFLVSVAVDVSGVLLIIIGLIHKFA